MKAKQEKGKENNLTKILESPGEKYISTRRIAFLILILALNIVAVFLLSIINGLLPDIAIFVSILSIVFMIVFFLELRTFRLLGRLNYDGTSYKKIFISYAISIVLMVIGGFLPDYFFPSAIIAIVLTSIMDLRLSFPAGIFIIIIFSIISGVGSFAFCNAVFVFVIAALLCDYRKEDGFSYYLMIILFLLQMTSPLIFYYLAHASYEKNFFLFGSIEAAADCFVLYFAFSHLQKMDVEEERTAYEDILDDNFSLVQDIKHFSMAEFLHARRVEKAARGCAHIIHSDEYTLAAAGFYYRLGKIYGVPESENAVKSAVNHCFPNSVIDIISKYGLKDYLPSTKEEAIVHISNEVITRFELLDSEKKDTFSNGWNQSIMVIQLLNELSSKGIYDESTLSINEFLRIRDFLADNDLMNID